MKPGDEPLPAADSRLAMRKTDIVGRLRKSALLRQAVRFVLSGGVNTLATYLLYLLLLNFMHYQPAYAVSFVAGILLAYALSTRFVFRTPHSWVKFSLFPLVYLISYAAGAGVLALAVRRMGVDERLAPIISACVTLPLSFALSRLVLTSAAPSFTADPGNACTPGREHSRPRKAHDGEIPPQR